MNCGNRIKDTKIVRASGAHLPPCEMLYGCMCTRCFRYGIERVFCTPPPNIAKYVLFQDVKFRCAKVDFQAYLMLGIKCDDRYLS